MELFFPFLVFRILRSSRRWSLVNSRLDYGNGTLIGLPANLTRRLQSVLNAALRLIFNLRHSNHVSDAPINLQWLCVPGCIRSKVAVQVYKVLHGCAPSYLGPFTYVADLQSPAATVSSSLRFTALLSAAEHFPLLAV